MVQVNEVWIRGRIGDGAGCLLAQVGGMAAEAVVGSWARQRGFGEFN
jgi:hypothetical protein